MSFGPERPGFAERCNGDSHCDLSTTVRFDLTPNLTPGLEGNNLLNSRQRIYDGVPEALRTSAVFGRVWKASVSFRF